MPLQKISEKIVSVVLKLPESLVPYIFLPFSLNGEKPQETICRKLSFYNSLRILECLVYEILILALAYIPL